MPAGKYTVQWVGPDAVVALPAEIDAANADKISQELRTRPASAPRLRILTLVGADQLVPIYPSLEAALAGAPPAEVGTPDPG